LSVAEDEDEKRQLFYLDTSVREEQVKWPVFAADYGEDFFKFKKDFLDAANQNRTSSKNQITKLRENLKSGAKLHDRDQQRARDPGSCLWRFHESSDKQG
jgi:hypothetical protein